MHSSIVNARLDETSPQYQRVHKLQGMSEAHTRVRDLRKAKGWSQIELAKRAGITQSTVSRVEAGDSKSSTADTMASLERALDLPPGSLTASSGVPLPEMQTVPSPDAAPTNGARSEFDGVAEELLASTPDAVRPGVAETLEKIRRSSSMQKLDMPLTVAALEDLVRVVSRHTVRRGR
jgi:transcriptional regulator with XRE-family HTH domain